MIKVHYIQHVAFEDLGSIESYLLQHGHEVSVTHIYKGERLPSINEFDWLIIMGGPMSVDDGSIYPWLKEEEKFIKACINAGKVVIGVCLGAQLIAKSLGARVYKNRHKEIGWFEVRFKSEINKTILSGSVPKKITAFHWHGETFDLPEKAVAIAESDACTNQAFIFESRVIAFQFHLETTYESALSLVENCRNELDTSDYVQYENEILASPQSFTTLNQAMFSILQTLEINVCSKD